MNKFYKFILLFLLAGLFIGAAQAQNTTVSGTVTDPDAFNWAGGSIQFALYNGQGGTVTYNGVPLTPSQLVVNIGLNSGGAFSIALSDNTLLQPVGTQWNISVCPAASAPCQTLQRVTISGSTQDLTTTINGQIKALRFSASYTARAYGQVEISPIPPSGGTYYDITLAAPKFWNGTAWVIYAGNTGGNPHAPVNSIQTANSALNSFLSDPNFLIDSTTHTRTSTANDRINSFESTPRRLYDPMDTKYLGGLAAAMAGTSGHTPTEVINATIDFAECQKQMGLAPDLMQISLPTGPSIPVSAIRVWSNQVLSGDSLITRANLQHTTDTAIMITGHASGDTLTCSNSVTYTPGGAAAVEIGYLGISGINNTGTGSLDIGIKEIGSSWFVHDITGIGNAFSSQGIWDAGFNNTTFRVGYPGAQINGCSAFTAGRLSGACQAVEIDSVDGEVNYVYATDGIQNQAGHPAGACYPQCAGIGINGSNVDASHLFGQISDIDILSTGSNTRGTIWRVDGSSREGVRLAGQNSTISDINITAVCTDATLATAYSAGTATGCAAVVDNGQGNQIAVVSYNGNTPIFGQSYVECALQSNSNGSSSTGGTYGFVHYFRGNPNNTSVNDRTYCGAFQGDVASGQVMFPSMAVVGANNATVDTNGVTTIFLLTATPATNFVGGVTGQDLYVTGNPGSSISTAGNIQTCTGLSEFPGVLPMHFRNTGGYSNGAGADNNQWREICNTPQADFVHLNWKSNPTPTNKYIVDFYGNGIDRQVPNIVLDASQLHGPTVGSGHYCFVEEAIYNDGNHNVSQQACTTVDLTNQTAGEIFVVGSTQVATYNLYMNANTTGSGIPLGKFPAPTSGFWNGPTTIAAGGDGSASPAANENNTGMFFYPWGAVINTTANTQPPCTVATRGRQWLLSGGGAGPDTYQICEETTGSTFAWISH